MHDVPSGVPGGLRWIALPASAAAIVVTVVGVATTLPGQATGVIVTAAVALAVGAAGTMFVNLIGSDSLVLDLAALLAVGFAGAVLAGLLPDTPGFVLVYLALLVVVPVGAVFYHAFSPGLGSAWDAFTTPDGLKTTCAPNATVGELVSALPK